MRKTFFPLFVVFFFARLAFGQNEALQAKVEDLLARAVKGDSAATSAIVSQSGRWTGKLYRTDRADQRLNEALNSHNMQVREAGLRALLAFEGVPKSQTGFEVLSESLGDSESRPWHLVLLGMLGHTGVDPAHVAKVVGAYLTDSDAESRARAIDGLAMLATDETIPLLLHQLRNDPSPIVQERAACGLAESGMYTPHQRLEAAGTMVGWINDATLNAQQKTWLMQALRDISGQNFGDNAGAWKKWLAGALEADRKTTVTKI
jgi:hypothetical protein